MGLSIIRDMHDIVLTKEMNRLGLKHTNRRPKRKRKTMQERRKELKNVELSYLL